MEVFLDFLRQKEFLAPWLQAILSALAILIAYELGLRQAKNQQRSALRVAQEEHRIRANTFLQAVLAIVEQADQYFSDALSKDQGVSLVIRVTRNDLVSIRDIVDSINSIPLHELPLPSVATELLALRNALRTLSDLCKHIPTTGIDFTEGDVLDLSCLVPCLESGSAAISTIRSEITAYSNVEPTRI
jgi:hypothetical protein